MKRLIHGYDGVLIGISAGTMNSARIVYSHPEREGEAASKDFVRFFDGLGLTEIEVIPHYQLIKGTTLDGMRLFDAKSSKADRRRTKVRRGRLSTRETEI